MYRFLLREIFHDVGMGFVLRDREFLCVPQNFENTIQEFHEKSYGFYICRYIYSSTMFLLFLNSTCFRVSCTRTSLCLKSIQRWKDNFTEDFRNCLIVWVPLDLLMFAYIPLHLRTPFVMSATHLANFNVP